MASIESLEFEHKTYLIGLNIGFCDGLQFRGRNRSQEAANLVYTLLSTVMKRTHSSLVNQTHLAHNR